MAIDTTISLRPSFISNGAAAAAESAAADVRRTRFPFAALCCYLASQAVYLPIVAIGPSWATWPTPPDLAAGLATASLALGFRNLPIRSVANRRVLSVLLFLTAVTLVAFVVMSGGKLVTGFGGGKFANFAVYQVYRTVQFLLIFRLAAGIPLTRNRLAIMARIVEVVIVFLFLTVAATSVSILQTKQLIGHVPASPDVAGAWSMLWREHRAGVGTVGWDHAYVALQLIMLTSLRLSLRGGRQSLSDAAFILLAAGAVFLSGSRSGMAAVLLFLGLFSLKRSATMLAAGLLAVMTLLAAGGLVADWEASLRETLDRQLTLKNPLDSDNLSGRQYIWQERMEILRDDPVRWIIGSGLGTSSETSRTAHCLYLHIFIEAGILGLVTFGFIFLKLIGILRRFEPGLKPVYLATFGFLLSAMTQETFYPVSYLGHFIGFYLCSVAIALRPNPRVRRILRRPIMEADKA